MSYKTTKKLKIREYINKFGSIIIIALSFICLTFYIIINKKLGYEIFMRFDQYAVTIAGAIIGVIGTMFGLTAASYAFVWGELKSEEDRNIRLQQILAEYRSQLWNLFFNALVLSFFIIVCNLFILGVVQTITKPTLSYIMRETIDNENAVVNTYYNQEYTIISVCIVIDLFVSFLNVILMAGFNYDIFNRKIKYEKIAEDMLVRLNKNYKLDKCEVDKINLNKIHYIELIINRLIKNHESEYDSLMHTSGNTNLLRQIITIKLKDCQSKFNKHDMCTNIPNENKKDSFIEQFRNRISYEIKLLKDSNTNNINEEMSTKAEVEGIIITKPMCTSFTKVYDDLILYRNVMLITGSSYKINDKYIDGITLRKTIKKRLLLFFMSHERFDNMDLSNMSLSGANLSYSNFSNCNLKGVKLKGSNCRGADFTGARMLGIHFENNLGKNNKSANAHKDDIVISYDDDNKNEWNAYYGHQATCLEKATFANADVSRMTLLVNGEVERNNSFPFEVSSNTNIPVSDKSVPFSLKETNFDNAKLFNAIFNNVDFSQASICQTQMYNNDINLTIFLGVNLSETVMTHSQISYSTFAKANLKGSVLSDCSIQCCAFPYANLSSANFSNSIITACNFKNSICNDTSFKNITFGSKNLHYKTLLSFEYATLRNADFSNANILKCNFSHANALNCIFTKTVISFSLFMYSILTSTIWNTATIKKSTFKCSIMRDCVFIYANFIFCTFEKCDFSNSIVNCNFRCCKMINVKFCDVKNLDPALFEDVTLVCVDFSGSNIKASDFNKSVIIRNCIFDNKDGFGGKK